MIINNYVMHKLDKLSDKAILSKNGGRMTAELDKYLQKTIKRVIKDDSLRKCVFSNYNDNIIRQACDDILYGEDFISNSSIIANTLFDVMGVSGDIASGALIICTYTEKDDTFLAILKLDYKEVYTEALTIEGGEITVEMGVTSTALSDRVKLAAIIGLNGINDVYHLKALDKDAEKEGYDGSFTSKFLEANKVVDDTYKTKLFMSKAENWITNAFSGEDIQKAENMKSFLAYTLKEKEELDIDAFIDGMQLDKDYEDSFREHFEDALLDIKEGFAIDKNWVEKKLKKRKVKMDNGFTINANLSDFEDPMKYSIRKNTGGSTDIVIKNVNFIEG